jgi:probable phosphoglycerate mutase
MALEQATRIIAIRHGETPWNKIGRIQGHTDIPLNSTGQAQARAVALALQGEPLAAIYSSDLRRAQETASAIGHVAGVGLRLDPALRERSFGRFEGLTWEEIRVQHPEESDRWRRREPDFAVGGGESLVDFRARCVAAVLRAAAHHPGEQIVIVAHGGVLDCFYRAACGLDLQASRSWPLGNATVNRLLAVGEHLSLVGWNDDQHLLGVASDDASA